MNDRAERILSMLNAQKETTVKDLASALYVSESSIRRDLALLTEQEKIIRTFRGARLRSPTNDEKLSFIYRTKQNASAKEKIAKAALSFIHDGDRIMLDDSSTALFIVPHLTKFKRLIVFTNCIQTSYALCELGINNYGLGGRVHDSNKFAFIGPYAEKMLSAFHGQVAFFSCKGLSYQGEVSSDSDMQDALRQIMISNCRTSVLLCDSTKIGKVYTHTFTDVQSVNAVLCDEPLPEIIQSKIGILKNKAPQAALDEFMPDRPVKGHGG